MRNIITIICTIMILAILGMCIPVSVLASGGSEVNVNQKGDPPVNEGEDAPAVGEQDGGPGGPGPGPGNVGSGGSGSQNLSD